MSGDALREARRQQNFRRVGPAEGWALAAAVHNRQKEAFLQRRGREQGRVAGGDLPQIADAGGEQPGERCEERGVAISWEGTEHGVEIALREAAFFGVAPRAHGDARGVLRAGERVPEIRLGPDVHRRRSVRVHRQ